VQGFWTAAKENIPAVYVICNNGAYKVLKRGINTYKKTILNEDSPSDKYIGMDFGSHLNMAGLAEDMGVYGRRIEDPADLGPAVREALDSGKPAVLDVIMDESV
jgi:benzoylformate decarboxylase